MSERRDDIMIDLNGEYVPDYLEPFRWLDPFEEERRAEWWKQKAARLLLREEKLIDDMRDSHERQVYHLRCHIKGMTEAISKFTFSPSAPPFLVKPDK